MTTDAKDIQHQLELQVSEIKRELDQKNEEALLEKKHLECLFNISELTQKKITQDELFYNFLKIVCDLCSFPVSHLYWVKNSTNIWSSRIGYIHDNNVNYTDLHALLCEYSSTDEGLLGDVVHTKEPVWVPVLSESADFIRKSILRQYPIHSYFAVPIIVHHEVIAIAEFLTYEMIQKDIKLLETIRLAAQQISNVLEQGRMTNQISQNYEELKKTYSKLKEAQSQLVQSEKMASLGTIAAGVAHEINNPMGYILSNFKTMNDYLKTLIQIVNTYEETVPLIGKSEEALKTAAALSQNQDLAFIKEDAEKISSETLAGIQRVKDIVQGLKTFARSDVEETQDVDVNACLETTLKMVLNSLKYHCTFEKNYGNLPQIKGHASQLSQVFMNMFVNAGHAIEPKGKGTIFITTEFKDPEIKITVRDTGKGIPANVLPQIFTPFFTTKPVGQGTGLGLSISYNIIEKHGGRILVDSTPGEGTTFTIFLPLVPPTIKK